jgi:radical SAM-linked protein
MKARIKFAKYGVIRFIGHLDLMRYFQKAVRRAGIDIAYSEGYNPHQIMSFASPLGLGITSDGEYLDIALNSDIDKDDIVNALNAQMVDGVKILDFVKLKDEAKKSMSKVAAADYVVKIKDDYLDASYIGKEEIFKQKFEEFMAQDEIVILKKSKKTENEVNIKPMIIEYSFEDKLSAESVIDNFNNKYYVYFKVQAGSVTNLKPELIMEAFCNYLNKEYNKYTYQVHRLDMYATDENDVLKSLNDTDIL